MLLSLEESFKNEDFNTIDHILNDKQILLDTVSELITKQIKTIRTTETSPKNSKLYFALLLEANDLVKSITNLLELFKEFNKFESIESKINKYNNSIIVYQNEIELKQNKNQQIENIKGIAARSLNKTRQIANKIKINMEINNNCPYCEQPIVEVHVDHIFPVAKGGLSTTKNMVRVCSKCNIKKKDLTLNQFIKKYNLNRNLIESNLEILNKIY